jgi:hypothetical protein
MNTIEMKIRNRFRSALIALFILCATSSAQQSLVNFAHIERLTERIYLSGDSVNIVHVYADFPSYQWTDAGDEGIACVDDAARAAVVFLRSYELTHDASSLAQARSLLKFVIAMQADDGEFYNFIFADHSINRQGQTSFKSFGWWAARGIWSMSLGYRIFKEVDPQFADTLKHRIDRSIPHIKILMKKYGEVKTTGQLRIPQWLLYESGADVTSELLLGLTEYYRATNEEHIRVLIGQLSDGLMMMQDGNAAAFPYGLHRSWETMWHAWGNSQSFALAYAGKVLRDTAMVVSAEREARAFYSRLLIEGMVKEWDVAVPQKKIAYEQIAYGIRPLTLGLLRLYDATGKELYQKMAGLAASWLFGNNVLHEVMYDTSTGRCYDGITDSTRVNRNSGAESAIEALYTLLEIEQYPLAKKYLRYKKINGSSKEQLIEGVFRNESGDVLTLALDLTNGNLTLHEGKGIQ